MTAIDFSNIRSDGRGQTEAFEEFAAQLFRNLDVVEETAKFERYRGDGGDGGVEAVWRMTDGSVAGLQAKFFLPLKAAHKAQLTQSFTEAMATFAGLNLYIIALPFDPTPTVPSRKGIGEVDRLKEWEKELLDLASTQGRSIEIKWWFATELRDRLLALPNADGRLLYWFGAGILGSSAITSRIKSARAIAGPRYSPVLKVGTPADNFISAVGALPRWFEDADQHRSALKSAKRRWNGVDPADAPEASQIESIIATALALTTAWREGRFDVESRTQLVEIVKTGTTLTVRAEADAKAKFDAKHGADKDTPAFRQFEMEYNVRFPAEHLDRARDLIKVWENLTEFANGPAAQAVTGIPALLVGPAGIGKTHALIDAAEQRVQAGYPFPGHSSLLRTSL
jgi:hypothetical protein